MKIQRIASVLMSALLILGFASCNSSKSPKAVTEDAVKAVLTADADAFYNHLCSKDQEAITKENLQDLLEFSTDASAFAYLIPEVKNALKPKDFKETISGETATVTFVLVTPNTGDLIKSALDFGEIAQVVVGKVFKSSEDIPEDIKNKLTEYVKKNGVPTTENIQQFNLVREDKDWKIDLDIPTLLKTGKGIIPFSL